MTNGKNRVAADAAARGLNVDFVELRDATGREPRSLEEAAAILGISPADILKSLVVKRSDGTFLFALVPGDRTIAWPKLRELLGVSRLSMPDADAAFAVTGFRRGTITPFGTTRPLPVVADERVLGRRVSIGGGEHGVAATVDGDALVAHFGAQVADVTDPEG